MTIKTVTLAFHSFTFTIIPNTGRNSKTSFGLAGYPIYLLAAFILMCIVLLFTLPLAAVGTTFPILGVLILRPLIATAMYFFGMDVEFAVKIACGSIITTIGLVTLLFWSHGAVSLIWPAILLPTGLGLLYSYF